MNTGLFELFDDVAVSHTPDDLAERAVAGARRRCKQRYAVGGSVLATAAVVLGVVTAVSDVRSDALPRPTDVASIPGALPKAGQVPNLEPGDMHAAAIAYVSNGELVLVDSAGDAARRVFGPPVVPGELTPEPVVSALDVALSPDGLRAVVTVEGWPAGLEPTTRVLDIEAATESVVTDVTPVDDAGAVTVRRPSVYAWSNDSQSFSCACVWDGLLPSGRPVAQLYEVTLTADTVEIVLSSSATDISPPQVATGSAGTFAQEGEMGPWWPPQSLAEQVLPIEGYALALDRGDDMTYVVMRGSGFTLGNLAGRDDTFSAPLPSGAVETQYVVVTDVEAVVGGFVAVVAHARQGEEFDSPADAITQIEAVFIRSDGAQLDLTRFPQGTSAASFASNLVAP